MKNRHGETEKRMQSVELKEAEEDQNTVFILSYMEKKLPELHYLIEINTMYAICRNVTYNSM